jgi:hypothetical protein
MAIRIDNPYGDVRLRRGGRDGEYELAAVLQQLAGAARRLEIRVDKTDAGLDVGVVSIVKPGLEIGTHAAADRSRADLVMMVPDGFWLSASTESGEIDARGVLSDLELSSESGNIRAAGVQGGVDARSNSGDIHVAFVDERPSSTHVLETVTGSVAVWLAPDADVTVTMSSSGTLTTDFSLQVTHRDHEEPDKVGRAKIGRGGSSLELRSLQGNLFLRRRAVVD